MYRFMDWFAPKFLVAGLIVCLVMLIAMPFHYYYSCKENDRLMSQCLKDGKKEYECRALVYPRYVRY